MSTLINISFFHEITQKASSTKLQFKENYFKTNQSSIISKLYFIYKPMGFLSITPKRNINKAFSIGFKAVSNSGQNKNVLHKNLANKLIAGAASLISAGTALGIAAQPSQAEFMAKRAFSENGCMRTLTEVVNQPEQVVDLDTQEIKTLPVGTLAVIGAGHCIEMNIAGYDIPFAITKIENGRGINVSAIILPGASPGTSLTAFGLSIGFTTIGYYPPSSPYLHLDYLDRPTVPGESGTAFVDENNIVRAVNSGESNIYLGASVGTTGALPESNSDRLFNLQQKLLNKHFTHQFIILNKFN